MSINKIFLNLEIIFSWYESSGPDFVYTRINQADSIQMVTNPIIVALLENRGNSKRFIEVLEFAYYEAYIQKSKLSAVEKFFEEKEIVSVKLSEKIKSDLKSLYDSSFLKKN